MQQKSVFGEYALRTERGGRNWAIDSRYSKFKRKQ